MTGPPDERQRMNAARIDSEHHSRWLVIWGPYSRDYWAFPRFQARPGTVIAEPAVPELLTRMYHAEVAARIRPPAPARNRPAPPAGTHPRGETHA